MKYSNNYFQNIKDKMDQYAHLVYQITKEFPREEVYGITSQLRRASLSVVLNFIEGYARQRSKFFKNFIEISYGSLKESEYLLNFSQKEGLITEKFHGDFNTALLLADEIGAILWKTIQNINIITDN